MYRMFLFMVVLAACDTSSESTPASEAKPSEHIRSAEAKATDAAPAAQTGHAPGGVVPGSHEDWCAEHAVPESQCTRCDPSLVAAFKATGDWCPEHGLPESQCLICNPDVKITRPPKEN